jgi:hypothetical protein
MSDPVKPIDVASPMLSAEEARKLLDSIQLNRRCWVWPKSNWRRASASRGVPVAQVYRSRVTIARGASTVALELEQARRMEGTGEGECGRWPRVSGDDQILMFLPPLSLT